MGAASFPVRTNLLGKVLLFAPSIFVVLLLISDIHLGLMLLAFYVPLLIIMLNVREAYELTDQVLRFRQGGLTSWSIPLESIVRAQHHSVSNRFAAGPREGVKIDFDRTSKLLTVTSSAEFLSELAARAPHLRSYNQELRSIQAALT